jgi:hypothetical protein
VVLAPYASGSRKDEPSGDPGTPLDNGSAEGDVGLDVKWTPFANSAIDATVNPDFSQIEADVAQIGANERFALFFPEKRPFFLEGIDLLSSPLQAVYTRTITQPRFGLRGTGKAGHFGYTALVADDRGGGSVVIPGPNGSSFADQDFHSWVAIGRVRRDIGRSFVSVLATDREIDGGAYNRVVGPDFQWRPNQSDNVTGQFLMSFSQTPVRTDLASEWDGAACRATPPTSSGSTTTSTTTGSASTATWATSSAPTTASCPGRLSRAVRGSGRHRAPHQGPGEAGPDLLHLRPLRRPRRRPPEPRVLARASGSTPSATPSSACAGPSTGYGPARVRKPCLVPRLVYVVQTRPSRVLSELTAEGSVGGEVDFDNGADGQWLQSRARGTLRPTDHLELRFNVGRRHLDVDQASGPQARLFTAEVDRLRATYNFSARSFVRVIGQYVSTTRDPSLYLDPVAARTASFAGSLLLAYKLNWQTVVFAGYGDDRELLETDDWARTSRQFFVKVSYAFQR